MSTRSSTRALRRGFLAGLPFILVIGPFGLLFGVLADQAGLDIVQTLSMTTLVIAGASQFTALALMQDHAPTLIVIAAALAVNLRLALYSASIAPHIGAAPLRIRALAAFVLVDQTFALAVQEYERRPDMTLDEKLGYFFGSALAICTPWVALSGVGMLVGRSIPPEYALDFAVPLTFIALVAPQLRSLPHVAAAFTSVVVALALAWMPWSTGVLVAGLAAMAAGAETERRLTLRRSRAEAGA
ncbi:AzlC family ABC transporter permease [Paroceanicella profunda]|uniref:AzlC family ABC transporter permease n=1 Tax=Paroceanicella profunda TaxID=2579971 RepID=A0A5B8G059_9RHOB|nr:AzlC family ABC transporter permease [Paroceanicella profunda]QDL92392.1 AzlC family ABC transporter permease [Paroceanicella profunda]